MPNELTFAQTKSLFRVEPGSKFRLKDHHTEWHDETMHGVDLGRTEKELKSEAQAFLQENLKSLSAAQELLWASDQRSLLVIFQAMDAAGKDGTIKHVMSGLNPQGCSVHSFKRPSDEEYDHTYLWRHMKLLPERGKIVVFNRSHYENLLVTKVHPEWLTSEKLPAGERDEAFWRSREQDINNMEMHLWRNGVTIVKFFLHVSQKEQRKRFIERLTDTTKHWKFSLADLSERMHWDAYMKAYEEAIRATSTEWAPWWVIPADQKYVTRAIVSSVLRHTIEGLGLQFPEVPDAQKIRLAEALATLRAED
ncbi:MAG: polyphosphate kinase 2 family protein [Phycisphaerales bacterium]|nr:polyphosphate kinase 2 family protein [Phycisphaerales bacterium]